MNTFASLALTGFSPFEFAFVQKLPDSLNLSFLPLEEFTSLHKDYLQLLTHKAEFIAGILFDYKTQLAQDRVLNVSMYQKVETFSDGDLLYLLASHISSLQTGMTKFRKNYVGPLVTDTMLRLHTLQIQRSRNRVLLHRFNINRLKLPIISTPVGTVNIQQLIKALNDITHMNTIPYSDTNISSNNRKMGVASVQILTFIPIISSTFHPSSTVRLIKGVYISFHKRMDI